MSAFSKKFRRLVREFKLVKEIEDFAKVYRKLNAFGKYWGIQFKHRYPEISCQECGNLLTWNGDEIDISDEWMIKQYLCGELCRHWYCNRLKLIQHLREEAHHP